MLETLKQQIIEQLHQCTDPDLLDLIMKLLIAEG
jgi:metal-sulfur cluster biosynthetic enzyme